jgi:uncharacterized UPF0160 family protein
MEIKEKIMDKLTFVTHNGVCHADEVVAFVLALLLGADKVSRVVERTRDPGKLAAALADPSRMVIDVGGVYDPSRLAFDHHQDGSPVRPDGKPYSAAGLVLKWLKDSGQIPADMADALDADIVRGVDAHDNGERVSQMTLSNLIAGFLPAGPATADDFDNAFYASVEFVKPIIERWVATWNQRAAQVAAADKALAATPAGLPYVVLPAYNLQAGDRLAVMAPEWVKYFVYTDPKGTWMCQQIPDAPKSAKGRKPLPEAWANLRDDKFQEVTGVKDAVFCHKFRFLCGAGSMAAACHLAQMAADA